MFRVKILWCDDVEYFDIQDLNLIETKRLLEDYHKLTNEGKIDCQPEDFFRDNDIKYQLVKQDCDISLDMTRCSNK